MQQTTGVEVLATHLAHTDRRALSQAWYSALHLAERGAEPARTAASGAGPRPPESPSAACTRRTCASTSRPHTGVLPARAVPVAGEGGIPERRQAKNELARRIERGLAQRTPYRGAASFAVRAGGGRIHLVVRADGDRTRVVAVCPPPLRERVERALAQARFALAGRGIRAEVA